MLKSNHKHIYKNLGKAQFMKKWCRFFLFLSCLYKKFRICHFSIKNNMSKFSSDLFSCISDSFLDIVGFPLVCEVFRIPILLRRWFIQLFKVCGPFGVFSHPHSLLHLSGRMSRYASGLELRARRLFCSKNPPRIRAPARRREPCIWLCNSQIRKAEPQGIIGAEPLGIESSGEADTWGFASQILKYNRGRAPRHRRGYNCHFWLVIMTKMVGGSGEISPLPPTILRRFLGGLNP